MVALLDLLRLPLIVSSVVGYSLKGVVPWAVFLLTKGELAVVGSGVLYFGAAVVASVYNGTCGCDGWIVCLFG